MTSLEKSRHLLRRAGFGVSPTELTYILERDTEEVLDRILENSYLPIDSLTEGVQRMYPTDVKASTLSQEQRRERAQLRFKLQGKWIDEMANDFFDGNPFLERMSLFWHDHFACTSRDYRHLMQYLEAIRANALGNFKDLLVAVSKSAAMLKYLNNQRNTKARPNENFARELLELFTMGVGNYSEKDIQEAARAFTGWNADKQGNFRVTVARHDNGTKTFMGKTGKFSGEDIIDIILRNKQTAQYIAQKVYKYFVNEKEISSQVDELADELYRSDYDIKSMMQYLFSSDWFYSSKNIGTKIKSPIDLLVCTQKVLETSYGGNNNLLYFQRVMGQELFAPPNVAGWNRGENWINNSRLIFRLKLTSILLQKDVSTFALQEVPETFQIGNRDRRNRFSVIGTNLGTLRKVLKGKKVNEVDNYLRTLLLSTGIDYVSKQKTCNSAQELTFKILELTALPEYQVC